MRRVSIWISSALLAAGLTACGARQSMNPANVQQVGAVQADISAAEKAGGDRDPRASMHIALAKKQLAEAQRLSNDGDGAEASRALARAELDAELALAITREANMRREAEETRARISEIQARGTTVEVTR